MSQTRLERKQLKQERLQAAYNKTKTLIASGKFYFEARWANPLDNDAVRIGQSLAGGNAIFQGNRVDLMGNPNYAIIKKDSARISLPFFGRVFFPRHILGTDGGIEFEGAIEDVSITFKDKKRRIDFKFKAKGNNETLYFRFFIYSGGASSLNVTSINRQTIMYEGRIFTDDEDDVSLANN